MKIYAIFSDERMVGYSTTKYSSNNESTIKTTKEYLVNILDSNLNESVSDFEGYTGYLRRDSSGQIVFNEGFEPVDEGGI